MSTANPHRAPWRNWLHTVIFGTESRLGRGFDIVLLVAIVASVVTVMVESVPSIDRDYGHILLKLEILFTIIFTLEYLLRLASSTHPLRYARSFYGVIDLLSFLPTYLIFLLPTESMHHAQALLVLRSLRLLRMFRVLKLSKYVSETAVIGSALKGAREKILVFFMGVLSVVMIMGTLVYLIEGPEHGFDSIPTAVYWAIITVTTVGYGDISPGTAWGKAIASVGVLVGYAIIAVPTGIVTSEFERARRKLELDEDGKPEQRPSCLRCGEEGLPFESRYCLRCGEKVELTSAPE